MKVIKSGSLVFSDGDVTIAGWTFDCEGRALEISMLLPTALDHIAEVNGVHAAKKTRAELDAELSAFREANNAIQNIRGR